VALAATKYPNIVDMLDWSELRKAFLRHDNIARRRKKYSQRRGVQGLIAGLAALWLGAIDLRVHEYAPSPAIEWVFVGVSFFLVVTALLLGGHILRGESKSEWLHHRLASERLRQLHFQWLISKFATVASTTPSERGSLRKDRELRLSALQGEFAPGRADLLSGIIDDHGARRAWLIDDDLELPALEGAHPETLSQLFRAYGELRIEHQADFARKKLEDGHGFWPWSPRGQAERIQETANALTVMAVVLNLLALLMLVLVASAGGTIAAWLETVGLMAAMCVLALRVLDQGVQPRADVARYRAYRGEIEELQREFNDTTDAARKLGLMVRVEELSYRELRDFIAAHNDASFIF
jgi:hypothetical protein